VRPFLGPLGAREGSTGGLRDQERIDYPQVLETALCASLAKQVFGDPEPGCRLRRRKHGAVRIFIENMFVIADRRLTKILVIAYSACTCALKRTLSGSRDSEGLVRSDAACKPSSGFS
jgi:hypothetical protein